MRIVIDTKEKKIICPKPFWEEVQKKNDILVSVGQPKVSHHDEVKRYFEEAIQNELVRAQDIRRTK